MTDTSDKAIEAMLTGDLVDLPIGHMRSMIRALQAERKAGWAAERDRCMRIVSAARNGDIDQDMRTLLHFMECGDQMVFDADTREYLSDHVVKDRALIAALTPNTEAKP